MINKIILATCLLFISPLAAAPDLAHPLTLSELIGIALENHPETQRAWWIAQQAAAALGSAESAYYPQIDLNANATHGRDFKFINGPDTNYTIIGADLTLSMLLFDFGERKASVEAAKMALSAANWQTDWTIQKVIIRVIENAYSTFHAYETLQAALVSLKDAEKMWNAAHELNRTGLTPISDVYTSQATLSQMRMELAQQKALFDIHKAKLAASLGLPVDTPLLLAPLEAKPILQKQQTDELITLARRQRSDLMAKQAQLSASFSRQDQARTAFGPKVSFSGRGGADHAFHDRANAGHYQVTLNIDFPLFTGFDNVYQNRMAYADTQTSLEELAQLELDIALEVVTYSRSLEAAAEMLCYAEDNLSNALKAYEGVLQKYQSGKETIAEVSNALRQLAAARVLYSDVKTRYLTSMANLAYSTGTLAPYMEIPCESNP